MKLVWKSILFVQTNIFVYKNDKNIINSTIQSFITKIHMLLLLIERGFLLYVV